MKHGLNTPFSVEMHGHTTPTASTRIDQLRMIRCSFRYTLRSPEKGDHFLLRHARTNRLETSQRNAMRNKKRNGGDRESDQDCYHHKASDQTFSLGSLWAHVLSGLTLKVTHVAQRRWVR